jgi:hypothetical protein
LNQYSSRKAKATILTQDKRDLHYKIKEWGYIFPTEEAAKNYADTHKVNERGFIEEIQNVPSEDN